MMPYQQLHFRPGSKYSYSNPASSTSARIIEKITGDPWASYVQKNMLLAARAGSQLLRRHAVLPRRRPLAQLLRQARLRDASRQRERQRRRLRSRDHDPERRLERAARRSRDVLAFLTNAPGGRLPRDRYDVVLRRASLEEMWRPVVETTSGYGSESDFMGLSFFGTRPRTASRTWATPAARPDSARSCTSTQ